MIRILPEKKRPTGSSDRERTGRDDGIVLHEARLLLVLLQHLLRLLLLQALLQDLLGLLLLLLLLQLLLHPLLDLPVYQLLETRGLKRRSSLDERIATPHHHILRHENFTCGFTSHRGDQQEPRAQQHNLLHHLQHKNTI